MSRDFIERQKDKLREMHLQDDAMHAWAEFCANCRERITESQTSWVRKCAFGDPEAPDIEDEWYCERCISIDSNRQFDGSGPPPMENIHKR